MGRMSEEKIPISPDIGIRIQMARSELDVSREYLAGEASIDPRFLADVECGKKDITSQKLMRICEALHVTSDYILFGKRDHAEDILMMLNQMNDKQKKLAKALIAAAMENEI